MKSKIRVLLSCLLLIVSVVVIQSCGDDDDSKPKPTASFTPSKTTAAVNEAITFSNTSENATSYVWSFGDGTTSTEESPSKSFATAGEYEVTLSAKGAGGTNSTTVDITITAGSEIFFIDYTDKKIARFSVSAPATVTTVLDITNNNGLALAHDATNQKIYFSGLDADDIGGVWRINMDGTGLTDILTDLYDPYGVALNVAGNKLYVADEADGDDIGHIFRSNLDGSSPTAVVTMEGAGFRAVALDLTNNKMYYYEVQGENLYMANLDGTSQDAIVEGVYGYAIKVDTENDKIYFDDQNSGELKMANLDGTNMVTVSSVDDRVFGIDIDQDNNKLYWSVRAPGAIYQSDLDGSNKVTLKEGLSSPRGIFLKK